MDAERKADDSPLRLVHLSVGNDESALPESTGPTGKRSARKRACSVWSGGKAARPYLSLPWGDVPSGNAPCAYPVKPSTGAERRARSPTAKGSRLPMDRTSRYARGGEPKRSCTLSKTQASFTRPKSKRQGNWRAG